VQPWLKTKLFEHLGYTSLIKRAMEINEDLVHKLREMLAIATGDTEPQSLVSGTRHANRIPPCTRVCA
jgi:hypothetical protein